MPRYQAVIEFWADEDTTADRVSFEAKRVIEERTQQVASGAAQRGIATGSVEVQSLHDIRPVDQADAWTEVQHAS